MFTLTWITEKELERVNENKRDEFHRKKNMGIQSGGVEMRNVSGFSLKKWVGREKPWGRGWPALR